MFRRHRVDGTVVSTPSRRSQRERVEESSRRLAEAAIELIGEKGFTNTTAQEIGIRAGYSRAMVHERYGSKEALLETILADYERRIDVTPEPGATGLQRVLAPILGLREFAAHNPQMLRAMFSLNFEALHDRDVLRSRIQSWLDRFQTRLRDAVTEGQADGSIAKGFGAEDISSEIMATGIGYAYAWVMAQGAMDFQTTLVHWHDRVATRLQSE